MNMTRRELADWMKRQGESSFRGGQVYDWLMRGADFRPDDQPVRRAAGPSCGNAPWPIPCVSTRCYLSKIDETAKVSL